MYKARRQEFRTEFVSSQTKTSRTGENYIFNKVGEEREKRKHCGKTAQSQ